MVEPWGRRRLTDMDPNHITYPPNGNGNGGAVTVAVEGIRDHRLATDGGEWV